ncbi:MAG: winged helix-turn-helix domain-containing protein [Actinomycetota bacterium]
MFMMGADAAPVQIGHLTVDLASYRATFEGRDLQVSTTELELLAMLAANSRRVLSRVELAAALRLTRARSVDVMLTRLRHELGREFLRNVRGRGWILDPAALGG